jgi:hypothetical protein
VIGARLRAGTGRLLFIQYACKAIKGELTWVRGPTGITNDMAVKVFNTHGRISAKSVAARRTLFAPANPSIQANCYDNCVAYAKGADDYRLSVKNAPASPMSPQRRLRDWLSQNGIPGGQTSLRWSSTRPGRRCIRWPSPRFISTPCSASGGHWFPRARAYGQTRFNPHMNAFATNTLLPTHYDDFLSHIDSTYWYTY